MSSTVVKGLTEKQTKAMDFFSPGAVFSKMDLIRLTGLQANQLTPIMTSLIKAGKVEEFVDEDDPALTVMYRLPESPSDDIPPNTEPEEVADFVLDLSDPTDMVTIPMDADEPDDDELPDDAHDAEDVVDFPDEPSVTDLNDAVTAETPVLPMPTLAELVALFQEVEADASVRDKEGEAVKRGREQFGHHQEMPALIGKARGVIFRAMNGRAFPSDPPVAMPEANGDPLHTAIVEEHQTWLELKASGDYRGDALPYIMENIKGREAFAKMIDREIRPVVQKFLAVPDATVSDIHDALNKPKPIKPPKPAVSSNGGTPRVKTDFTSDATGPYTVIHGIIKKVERYAAWWITSDSYVRTQAYAATTGFPYNPQVFGSTAEKVVEKMNSLFPNATYNGEIREV